MVSLAELSLLREMWWLDLKKKIEFEPITQVLVHKVVDAPTGNAAMELLKRAKIWGHKHNYEEMQNNSGAWLTRDQHRRDLPPIFRTQRTRFIRGLSR